MSSCTELVCGTGTGNFPKPGDPDLNSPIISAQTRFGGILVSWSYPALLSHAVAHTILYRGANNDVNGAVPYATVSGSEYFDTAMTETPTRYYYWIRMVSVNGTVGDFIGPATAIMHPAGDSVAAELTGRIAESFLNTALRERINQITDVASALSDEIQERLLGSSIFSDILAQYQDRLDAVDTLVVDEIVERVTADSALVAQVNLILAKANDNAAAIQTEQAVRASETGALAISINTVQATANNNTASIQTTQTAVSDIELGLSATWTVRTDVNGRVAGIGLYNDGDTSDFMVIADNFAIATPGLAPQYPFIVGTVNGQSTIVMNAPTYWDRVIGADKPDSGATRNVFRGAWSTGLGAVAIGDIVLDGGNSWSAITAHTAAGVNRPPVSGDTNTWWTLYGAKGDMGEDGAKTAIINIYRRSTAAPALPTASTTYTFGTQVLTGLNNGWSTAIPSGTLPVWVSGATAYSGSTTDVIASSEWASPAVLAQNGEDGLKTATVTLFRRATVNMPPTPGNVTYNFATGSVSGGLNGWSSSAPGEHQGRHLWVTTATALEVAGTNADTIGSSEWATPVVYSSVPVIDSEIELVAVFRRLSSSPPLPTGTNNYNFATRTFTALSNSWSQDPPSDTAPLRMTMAVVRRVPGVASVPGASWSASVIVPEGAASNLNYAVATLYRRTNSESPPARPNGNTTYNFSTRSVTGSTNNWSAIIPPASNGEYLWVTHAPALSLSSTDAMLAAEWIEPYIAQGSSTATVYRRQSGTPSTPAPGFPFPPAGWSNTVPSGTDPVWESSGVKFMDTNQWSWNTPQISVTHWVRPGTTQINGNQIFTGDAYVDTLQIKGQAVTIPEGRTGNQNVPLSSVPSHSSDRSQFTKIDGLTQAMDLGSITGQKVAINVNVTVGNSGSAGSVYIWVYRVKSGVYTAVSNDYASIEGGRTGMFTTLAIDKSPGTGTMTYEVYVAGSHTAMSAHRYAISVIGMKR